MAVTLRSVGVSPGAWDYYCVIVKPVGLAEGDLMVAHIGAHNDYAYSTEDGWTSIRADNNSDNVKSSLFWKIADSDDAAASDFTFTTAEQGGQLGAIMAIQTGTFDADTPINAHNYGDSGSQSTSITSAEITPSVANCMILMICTTSDNTTTSGYAIATSNPSWTEAYDINTTFGADHTCSTGYGLRPETTATGVGSATSSGTDYQLGQLVAIAPVAAPTGIPVQSFMHMQRMRRQG